MFTVAQREHIRHGLVRAASEDGCITAAAFVGSAATNREDPWSDIDLALRIRPDLEPETVARHWTERMYADHDVVHHLDVWAGPTLYRVFLLPSTLQVDLSFWPSRAFAASGPAFRLLFGEANDAPPSPPPSTEAMVGMGWLYALHIRSSLARGRRWQAVHMLNGLREQVVALACLRFGLPPHQGRGVDDLPPEETELLADALVVSLKPSDLRRAFASAARLLLKETSYVDAGLASRLESPIESLIRSSDGSPQSPRS
jgi:predicted nucleotidyltransferase